MALRKEGLREALEKIFQHMEKNGLVTEGMKGQKDGLLESIANDLVEARANLSAEDVNTNINVQRKLMGMIAMKALGEKRLYKNFKENVAEPLDAKKQSDDLDEKLNLSLILIKSIDGMMKEFKKKNRKDDKDITEEELNDAIDKQVKQFDKKAVDAFLTALVLKASIGKSPEEVEKMKKEKNDIMNELDKNLSDTLKNLYGGDDPRIVGEVQTPILGPIMGNLFGFTNQTYSDPKSVALMIQAITYNAGVPDFLNLEVAAKNANKADGVAHGNIAHPSKELIDIGAREPAPILARR